MTKPECGLPVHQLTGVPAAPTIVRACAHLNVAWVVGTALTVSLILALMSWNWTQCVRDTDGERREPVIPMWTAAIPLGVAVLYGAVAVPIQLARLRVADASLATSTMDKATWLEYKAANTRTHGQVLGALGAASIVASSVFTK